MGWLTGLREVSSSFRELPNFIPSGRAISLSTISDDIKLAETQRIEPLVGVLHKADAGLVRKLDGVVGKYVFFED